MYSEYRHDNVKIFISRSGLARFVGPNVHTISDSQGKFDQFEVLACIVVA